MAQRIYTRIATRRASVCVCVCAIANWPFVSFDLLFLIAKQIKHDNSAHVGDIDFNPNSLAYSFKSAQHHICYLLCGFLINNKCLTLEKSEYSAQSINDTTYTHASGRVCCRGPAEEEHTGDGSNSRVSINCSISILSILLSMDLLGDARISSAGPKEMEKMSRSHVDCIHEQC